MARCCRECQSHLYLILSPNVLGIGPLGMAANARPALRQAEVWELGLMHLERSRPLPFGPRDFEAMEEAARLLVPVRPSRPRSRRTCRHEGGHRREACASGCGLSPERPPGPRPRDLP